MCERCQTKLNLFSKKVCSKCSRHFCHQCMSSGLGGSGGGGGGGSSEVAQAVHKRSPQTCRRCVVFSFPVMERSHLDELSIQELKGYQGIRPPLRADKEMMIQLILGHQARVLTERAQKAIRQINHTHQLDNLLSIDPQTLEPHTSTYSSVTSTSAPSSTSASTSTSASDRGAQAVAETTGGGHISSSTSDIRSRIRQQMQLKKSTEVLDTSGISRVDQLCDESQIDLLSVRQLKLILKTNCIDYRGCVEKSELMERVHRLYQDKLDQKELEAKIKADGDTEAESDYLCKVCMDSAVDCVFLDCGHMLTCVKCGRQLSECPVCRQYIVKVIHTFRV